MKRIIPPPLPFAPVQGGILAEIYKLEFFQTV